MEDCPPYPTGVQMAFSRADPAETFTQTSQSVGQSAQRYGSSGMQIESRILQTFTPSPSVELMQMFVETNGVQNFTLSFLKEQKTSKGQSVSSNSCHLPETREHFETAFSALLNRAGWYM